MNVTQQKQRAEEEEDTAAAAALVAQRAALICGCKARNGADALENQKITYEYIYM